MNDPDYRASRYDSIMTVFVFVLTACFFTAGVLASLVFFFNLY